MSRCTACNEELDEYESTRKTLDNEYLDMCNLCFSTIEDMVDTISREELETSEMISPEVFDFSNWSDD